MSTFKTIEITIHSSAIKRYMYYSIMALIIFVMAFMALQWFKEPEKECAGNVWNVEIYYNNELGLWMGEFDTFVGEKPVHAIAGSSKDKASIEKAINSYCR